MSACPMCMLPAYTETVRCCGCWFSRGETLPVEEPPADGGQWGPDDVSPPLWRITQRPYRSEAQARAERAVIAERAELYARMLEMPEDTADYMARCSWAVRYEHARNHFNRPSAAWAPLLADQPAIAAATLHADVAAETWTRIADDDADWSVIVSDLVDSATTVEDRERAQADYDEIRRRITRARDFAKALRAEHTRRQNTGRAA